MNDTDRLNSALAKWQRAKAGERPVISEQELNLLGDHFQQDDGEDASHYFKDSRTIHNPDRVGILDAYVLYL
jgi:hypothetical protein